MKFPDQTKITKLTITLAAFLIIVVMAFWLGKTAGENEQIQQFILRFGYLGIFLASLLSGINIIVPVPAVSFVPAFVQAGHNIWLTMGLIAIGVTLGDSIGYLIGAMGREIILIKSAGRVDTLEKLRQRYHWAPLVLLLLFAAFIPFPNEVLVIPLAIMGYKWLQLAPILFLGNTAFTIAAGYGFVNLFGAIF